MRTWLAGTMIVPLLSSMLFFSTAVDKPVEDTGYRTVTVSSALETKAAPAGTPHQEKLEAQVKQWIDDLSQSDAAFAKWTTAAYEIHPLGPGTSAWIVLLLQDGKDVGYLVVGHDTEGTLKLIEYGAGSYPLFSVNTLHRELVRSGIISNTSFASNSVNLSTLQKELDRIELIYNDPFEAVWEIELDGNVHWFDGKTGQPYELEMSPEDSERHFFTLSAAHDPTVNAHDPVKVPTVDPYEHFHWLVSDPITIENVSDFTNMLESGQPLTYFTSLFDHEVKAPFAVNGYQRWGDDAYVSIEHDGQRYISYALFQQSGEFYPVPDHLIR